MPTFTITVQSQCNLTTITSRSLAAMTVNVAQTAVTQDITFQDLVGTSQGNVAYCGVRIYTLNPSPTYLTISGTTLSLFTNSVSDVGSQTVILTVKLAFSASIPAVTASLAVSVTCQVQTLAFTPLGSYTIQIGITSQPYLIHFTTTEVPNCTQTPSFTLSPNTNSFSSIINISNGSGDFRIEGATLANKDTYIYSITGAVDSKTVTENFEIILQDPCQTAVFQTIPTRLVNISTSIPGISLITEAVSILTNVQVSNPTIVCAITATLSPAKAYIALSGNFAAISVNAALISGSDRGTNTFTLTVNSANFSATVAQKTYNFDVIIQCQVSSLTITSQASDSIYTLNQGLFQTEPFLVTQEIDCIFPYTYTHTFLKAGLPVAQPSWISFDFLTLKFQITISVPTDIGVYTITSTATIPQDDGTGVNRSKSYSCALTVQSDCINTSLIDKIINPMSTKVSQTPTVQDISFSDQIGAGRGDQTYCGTRTYTISPTHSFLQISGSILTLSSTNEADVGVFTVVLTVQLASFPGVTVITKNIVITIICEVLNLNFATQPAASTNIQVGISLSPFNIVFTTSQTPNCGNAVNFVFGSTYAFMSLQSMTAFAGFIQISNLTAINSGEHTQTLTASVNAQSTSIDFQVTVDFCPSIVFQTTPVPLSNMNVILPSSSIQTQTASIKTDVEIANPSIVCPITATLTPAAAYISLSADFKTISVNEAFAITPTDLGIKVFTLTVNSANFSGIVAHKTYNFNVIITCQVNSLTINSQASDKTYTLNQGLFETLPFLVTQNNACLFQFTYTHNFLKTGLQIAQPAWILFSQETKKLSFTIIDPVDIGIFTISSTATIPQDDGTGVNRSISYSFTLTVQSDCVNTSITDKIINPISTKVSQTATTQDISFADLISTSHGDENYCGTRTYSLSPTHSFLSVSGTSLTLSSTNVADVGVFNVVLTISLTSFSMIPMRTKTITVEVICEVISIAENLIPLDVLFKPIIDQPILLAFKFTESPQCGLTYTLTSPKPFIHLDSSQKTITVFTESVTEKGIYQTQLQVKPLTQGVNKAFDFNVTIMDICEFTSFVQPRPIPSIEIFIQSPDKANIQQTFPAFEYQAWKQYQYSCGLIHTQLLTADKGETLSWAKFSSENSISYDVSQFMKPFTQSFNLTASLQDFPQVQTIINFNFTLSSLEIECQSNQPQTYLLDSGTTTLQVGYLNKTKTVQSVTAVFESTGLDNTGKEIDLPSFFSFIRQNGKFDINTDEKNSVGFYKLGLNMYYKELPSYKVRCELPIKVSYNHIFNGDLIVDQTINCFDLVKIEVPEFTDYFGIKAIMTLDFGEASNFLKFDPSVGQIKTREKDSKILSQHTGSFTIKYKLTDSLDYSLDYSFLVNIVCFEVVLPALRVPPQRPYVASSDPLRPYIKSISPMGVVKIEFTKIISIPSYDIFPEFKEPGMMRPLFNATESNNTSSSQSRILQGIQETSRRQLKTQSQIEQEAIEIIDRGIVVRNNTNFPIIQLQLLAGNETDQSYMNFTYKCIKFEPNYMEFQTHYTHIDQISVRESKENIKAEFFGPQYFRTSTDESFSPDISISVEKEVPRQIDSYIGKLLTNTAKTMSNASKAVMIVNFLSSSALQQMLSAMKKMQIMIHLLLMDISIPSNVAVFFNSFLQLVTYNLINLEPMTRKFFKLYDDEAFSETFNQIGYQSQFSVINLGSVFVALIVVPPILMVVFFCKPLAKNKYVLKLRQKLKIIFIWDGIISIFNENYMVITVSCFINLFFYDNVQKKGQVFSFTVALAFMIVVVGYPIFVLVLLTKNYKRLDKQNFRKKFGSLYLGFKFDEGKLQVLEPFFSALRRLFLITAMIFLKGFPVFQLMVCTYSWAATVILNGYLMFVLPRDFLMEQINEVFIMILIYHMICFADLVTQETTRGQLGWSMVGFMCMNILFNFSVILQDSIIDFIKKAKLWWWKRKNRILTAKIQEFEDKRELIRQDYLEKLQIDEQQEEIKQEEMKLDLRLVNYNTKGKDIDPIKYREQIRKMWDNGLDEFPSPKPCNLVTLKSQSRINRKARPQPLGMNQDDSDPKIESTRRKGSKLYRDKDRDNFSDIIENSNENSYSGQESKESIQSVKLNRKNDSSVNDEVFQNNEEWSEYDSNFDKKQKNVFESGLLSARMIQTPVLITHRNIKDDQTEILSLPGFDKRKNGIWHSNQGFEYQISNLATRKAAPDDDSFSQFARVYQRRRMTDKEIAKTEQERFEELWINPKPLTQQQKQTNQPRNPAQRALPFPHLKKQKINLNDL